MSCNILSKTKDHRQSRKWQNLLLLFSKIRIMQHINCIRNVLMAIITLCILVKYIQLAIVDNVLTHCGTGPIFHFEDKFSYK